MLSVLSISRPDDAKPGWEGQSPITAETALRLARHFGTSPRTWLSVQALRHLEVAERSHGERVEREVQPRPNLDPTLPATAA